MTRLVPAAWLATMAIAACLASCKRIDDPSLPPNAQSVQELRAGCAALEQFAKDLQVQPAENDFQRFAASPYSYTYVVRESSDSYTFYFGLKPFQGRPVIDEGRAYKVDKADMKVVRIVED
jgi:hypothetical protein